MSEAIITQKEKKQLLVLPTDGFFLFPRCGYFLSLTGENEKLKPIIIKSWKLHKGHFLIVSSKESINHLNPPSNLDNFYSIGTLGRINLDLSSEEEAEIVINSLRKIQLEGLERIQIFNPIKIDGIWQSEYQILTEPEQNRDEKILNRLTEKFVAHLSDILKRTNPDFTEKLPYLVGNLGNFIDSIAQNNQGMSRQTKQDILASLDLQKRLDFLINVPGEGEGGKIIDDKIKRRVNEGMKKEEKIFWLRKRLGEIKKELSDLEGYSSEIQRYLQRLEQEPFPENVKQVVSKEINHYEAMPASSSEANIIKGYIDLVMSLPWWTASPEIKNLDYAQEQLDKSHYGLKKVKQRIIEHLAVSQHISQKTNETTGKVILLLGPPGTGKTSLPVSIAKALGRKQARISVGGISDEAEIRGHRKTYLGSMPGKIIQTMKNLGEINPVIVLDEVDKISRDFRGDPASALLEVLDPNQNKKFVDHYLGSDLPFDLSKVMFICTANSLENISRALRDRMEIIELSSYTEIEKKEIAKDYLIPNALKEHRIDPKQVIIREKVIEEIIRHYTWEAGTRELNRLIQRIIRKFVLKMIQKKLNKLVVTPENLTQYLGKIIYDFTRKEEKDQIGLVNGLAWTSAGGDILPIQASYSPGKGKLDSLTGSLGKVMKESALVAFNYVKANYDSFGVDWKLLKESDLHIHAPDGAVKKDGPSAGIALVTAIVSALTKREVPSNVGMTGEVDLLGNVLPIGGLREKSIAAHRSGLKIIFIPEKNKKDIEDIPKEVKNNLKIILVKKFQEVWENLFPQSFLHRSSSKERQENSSVSL